MAEWSLHEAKNNFGELVAADEYECLRRLDKADAPSLGELLVQIPQDDGEFERLSLFASDPPESQR